MRPIITEQEPDTEENVDKKEEKKFSVSLAIFNTFRSNWQKRKKEILNIVDDDPSRSDEVNQAINNTEEAIKYFDNAAKRYSEAAKNAKIEFDKAKEKGITSEEIKIKILCYPRIFGYVFNPLSIFFIYNN